VLSKQVLDRARPRLRRLRPSLRRPGLLLAGALALSACSVGQPGVAAQIGQREISTEQLAHAVAGIKAGSPELAKSEGLDRTVLTFLLVSPYIMKAGEQAKVMVSPDEAKKLLPKAASPDPDAVLVLQTFLIFQKLQSDPQGTALRQVQKDLVAGQPKINPRFGEFDLQQGAIVNPAPNWLVPKPATVPPAQDSAPPAQDSAPPAP
jgi:hypothetical protein